MEVDGLLKQDGTGIWAGSVRVLPGCFSQGESRRAALTNITEAITLHLAKVKPLALQPVTLDRVRVEA